MESYEKDISMAFDGITKYNDLVATCDKNNPKYSEYILLTRCAPIIKRKEYLVSAAALLSTWGLLPLVSQYGCRHHLQTAKAYCKKILEWYDKYSPPCDQYGNYHSAMGVIIKRYRPEDRPADLEAFFA